MEKDIILVKIKNNDFNKNNVPFNKKGYNKNNSYHPNERKDVFNTQV